jgi:hypothetical protein
MACTCTCIVATADDIILTQTRQRLESTSAHDAQCREPQFTIGGLTIRIRKAIQGDKFKSAQ